ncbi:MAG: PAS domain S-box protein [Dehalococcoidia bacterium]|nr:PAS domain S-box protein [Dehalococcoidia bacterium]
MASRFTRSWEDMRGIHYVLQDDRVAYARFEGFLPYGYSPQDVIGHLISERIHADNIKEVLEVHRAVLNNGKGPIAYDTVMVGENGSSIPMRCVVWPAMYRDKLAVAGVMTPKTELDSEERPHQEAADMAFLKRTGAANTGDGIAVFQYDRAGHLSCVYANREMSHLSRYSRNELKHLSLRDIFDIEAEGAETGAAWGKGGGTPWRRECDLFLKNGNTMLVEVRFGITESLGKGSPLLILYVSPISAKRLGEIQDRTLEQSLRYYASQLVNTQEEERRRLARELHDNTIQMLLSITDELADIEGVPQQRLAKVNSFLERTIKEVRSFTWDLRPPLLDDMGLAPTLRWFARTLYSKGDLKLKICVTGQERRLSKEVELSLFRIAQESIRNILRHAHASNAVVTLDFGEDYTSLTITDDGVGFDVPNSATGLAAMGKLGIMGMAERAHAVHGKFAIKSRQTGGTSIRVEVPL